MENVVLSLWQIKKKNKKKQNRLRNWRWQNHEKVLKAAISSQPIETPKLWKGLSCYFNPPTNYQVLAPLRSEDVVTIAQATMVGTK
jgi:DNA-binding transcriptional regulator WhiA